MCVRTLFLTLWNFRSVEWVSACWPVPQIGKHAVKTAKENGQYKKEIHEVVKKTGICEAVELQNPLKTKLEQERVKELPQTHG